MVEMEPGIRQALDDASTGFVSYEQLLERFLKALTEAGLQNDGQGVALWAAFSFHRDEQKGFTGSYAGSDPGEPWPTDPRQVPANVLAVWAAYAADARHPGVRARLHHLLWEARKGDAFQHARQAFEAYRDAAAEFLNTRGGSAGPDRRTLRTGADQTALPVPTRPRTGLTLQAPRVHDGPCPCSVPTCPGRYGALRAPALGDRKIPRTDNYRPLPMLIAISRVVAVVVRDSWLVGVLLLFRDCFLGVES
ncbi:DUF7380 domain-containing protein, partial [Streptomyces mirabilis]|uniref:DUF7380 domain-containing protein n=1 Tax=Streptomyces mirabilis TaxID=68239 RepID=UPI0036C4EC4C